MNFSHPGLDTTYVIILQHFYWPGLIQAVQIQVSSCEMCQCTKPSTIKYRTLPDCLAEEISCNKICVYLIGTYSICRKVNNKDLTIKMVMMIDTVMGWFEMIQYENKNSTAIAI